MSTEEGNKLIAEFMGAIEVDPIGNLERNISFKSPVDGIYCYNKTGLKYHSSWDWLHPVYRKVSEIGIWMMANGYDKLWHEVLTAAGFGFINRARFISELKQHFVIHRRKQ